ncbi:carboxypeptidase-like regulatory domain-containing protein [Mucilaginibacter sp. BJC16-A38]|uniref:carboxypeptidase-like regulatory domain-containing protein n=1 Tax=Mucilaginibacter phenanthrenivorans TaxID=1234842 RepID=UPI0021570EC3|nr:carboxypeptidase-like regulatory domain-containing protein [Mucilaginibacter phenanthrenivorans]MCR8561840.1 carboxypeptidase-like regulatory domain-containing protein [Mucilaginibacter phenanthrenivorans]
MKIRYILIVLLGLIAGSASAQDILKGTVTESGSGNKLSNVFIRDNASKQLGLTDKDGNFSIKTATGHLIIFDSPGYVSDTLFVVDMTAKKIVLTTKTIALREVTINSTRAAFDPHTEYPEVYEKSKLYVLSPTTWFGKDARDARRLKKYFKTEQEQRQVDAAFTRTYVGSIVPLKGSDLDDFMVMYRPSYAFIKSNDARSLAVYINDSYKKFEALPPEKRKVQALTTGPVTN